MEELTIIEQLSQLRITASSQMGRRPQGAGPDADHITSDSEYGAMVGEALRQGIVTKRVVSDREVYYLPGPKMLSPQLDFDGLHGAP